MNRVHSYDDVYFALQHIDHDETVVATDVATNVGYVDVRDDDALSTRIFSTDFQHTEIDRDDREIENQSSQRPLTSSSFRPIVDRGPDDEVCSLTRAPLRSLAPSRQRSRASTRPTSRASAVDLNWIGDFVIGVTQNASMREQRDAEELRRLAELAQAREKQLLDEARQREPTAYELAAAQEQYNLELMRNMMRVRDQLANEKERAAIELRMLEQDKHAELALKRAETGQQIALERENKIREDMRQLAALEARNVLLEQRLRDVQSRQEIVGNVMVASAPSPLSVEKQTKSKSVAYPPSPELDLSGNVVHISYAKVSMMRLRLRRRL